MYIRPILRGLSTYVPVLNRYVGAKTGGTVSSRYCYSVWARHLVSAGYHGLNTNPAVVAELGPGDSLGIGLAALISGSTRYCAFDVVDFGRTSRNLEIFDELVALFRARADIPGPDEFPKVKPNLESYAFPRDIFTEERLERAMEERRLATIRNSIMHPDHQDSLIEYRVPWYDAKVIDEGSVDLIYSQAVLEHVDDLDNTYRAMNLWLKPGGHASHQIDFKCHHTARQWNGHWALSDSTWRLIRGRHAYLLNRQPYSTHVRLLADHGFRVVSDQTVTSPSQLTRQNLATRFQSLSDDDLVTSGAFFLVVKQGGVA